MTAGVLGVMRRRGLQSTCTRSKDNRLNGANDHSTTTTLPRRADALQVSERGQCLSRNSFCNFEPGPTSFQSCVQVLTGCALCLRREVITAKEKHPNILKHHLGYVLHRKVKVTVNSYPRIASVVQSRTAMSNFDNCRSKWPCSLGFVCSLLHTC